MSYRGGSVQVGQGAICQAKGIGVIQLYARDMVTGHTKPLPEFKKAWYVPDMIFRIISVADLEDMGLGFLTRQEGRSSRYLHDSARGTKI